ncbi:MAG: HD domain-containing protein [Candidatus Hodarchaeota archaeon]
MYTTVQLGKILAMKRSLDLELAGLVCAFHDVYSLHTGEWESHGPKAESYVREITAEYNERWGMKLGNILDDEVELIITAIHGHSDKEIVTENAYAELLKDVDSLDAYLHGFEVQKGSGRAKRLIHTFRELGLRDTALSELEGI